MISQVRLWGVARAIGDWLHDWQTLVSGVLAIVAGGLTAYYLHKQIGQTERHERERLEREHRAARAVMPLPLMSILDACQDCIAELAEIHKKGRLNREEYPPQIPEFALSQDTVAILQDVIRTSNCTGIPELIHRLVVDVERVASGLKDLDEPSDDELDERIVDVAQVYALAAAAVKYAESDTVAASYSVGWDQVRLGLNRGVQRGRISGFCIQGAKDRLEERNKVKDYLWSV